MYFNAAVQLDQRVSKAAEIPDRLIPADTAAAIPPAVEMNFTCLWVPLPSNFISSSSYSPFFYESCDHSQDSAIHSSAILQYFEQRARQDKKTPDAIQTEERKSCKNQEVLRNSTKGKLTGENTDSLKERGITFLFP